MSGLAGSARLRQLLGEGLLVSPGVTDPFTARIAVHTGFSAVYLGGLATGASLGVMEPLLTLTEQAEHAARVASSVDVPVIVDGGAGFGGSMSIARMVQEFERAGVSGLHLEDLAYPKSVSYHKMPAQGNQIVSPGVMRARLRAAQDSRTDEDFVIIARTDAVHASGGGIDLAIERANIYGAEGADLLLAFPDNMADVARFAREVDYPVVLVCNDTGARPSPSVGELQELGYSLAIYAQAALLSTYHAVHGVYEHLYESGVTGLDPAEMLAARKGSEAAMGLPQLLKLEEQLADDLG
jgi:2-methylisocitrate lyase-like PEP mutase family enzyme